MQHILYVDASIRLKDDHKARTSQDFLCPPSQSLLPTLLKREAMTVATPLNNFMPPQGSLRAG